MVAATPVAGVVRDAFLAAGAGFLLGVLYRAFRAVLGNSRAACFFCDCAILALTALVFRSAAASAFTSGVMRWYTGLSMILFAFWSQRLLRGPSRCLHASLCAPAAMLAGACRHVWQRKVQKMQRRHRKTGRKHLKNPPRVLYNSK